MKIEDWNLESDTRKQKVWKHRTTNVRIVLANEGSYYRLAIYRGGVEQYRVVETNKSILEKESARWQRSYNTELKKRG